MLIRREAVLSITVDVTRRFLREAARADSFLCARRSLYGVEPRGDAEMTNYEMKAQAETAPEASTTNARSLSLFAVTTPEARLQVTRLHKAVRRNWWLLAAVLAISVASAWLGMR